MREEYWNLINIIFPKSFVHTSPEAILNLESSSPPCDRTNA